MLYVLLKALLPVCMKYTAQGESGVANIAQGEAECHICHKACDTTQVVTNRIKLHVIMISLAVK